MGPAIEKVSAAQVAAMMVRIFMGFLDLPIGWSSFFIVSSRPCRPADARQHASPSSRRAPLRTPNGSVSRDEVDVGSRLDNEHQRAWRERRRPAATANAMW